MISNELFKEVISGYKNSKDKGDLAYIGYSKDYIEYRFKKSIIKSINIYELAHKCKEWAFSKGYNIWSDYMGNIQIQDENFETVYSTSKSDTEIKEIFKSCEWILKELNK